MLLLFSTTFNVQGNPVGYHIFIDRNEHLFFFKPTLYSNRNIYPPSFYAKRIDGLLKFEGLSDSDLQNQATEDIDMYMNVEPKY
jgi:hypothetical protein